jgi:hypothetical protein
LVLSFDGISNDKLHILLQSSLEFDKFKYNIYSVVYYDPILKHYYCKIFHGKTIVTLNDETVLFGDVSLNGEIVLIFYQKI